GKEGVGVDCFFYFRTRNYRPGNDEEYRKARQAKPGADAAFESDLAEQFGYYEIRALPVTDYATQSIDLPGGRFENAAEPAEQPLAALRRRGDVNPAEVQVYVRCNSPTQYIGMARYDFYLRQDEAGKSEKLLFALNFFKSGFGLWLQLALVVGLA